MASASAESLHLEILALAETLTDNNDFLFFAENEFAKQSKRILALDASHHDKLITDILVIAARLQGEDAEHTYIAIAQLLALTIKLLGNEQKAEDAFLAVGLDLASTKNAIGSQKIQFEDNSQNKAGDATASLLGVLRNNKN